MAHFMDEGMGINFATLCITIAIRFSWDTCPIGSRCSRRIHKVITSPEESVFSWFVKVLFATILKPVSVRPKVGSVFSITSYMIWRTIDEDDAIKVTITVAIIFFTLVVMVSKIPIRRFHHQTTSFTWSTVFWKIVLFWCVTLIPIAHCTCDS